MMRIHVANKRQGSKEHSLDSLGHEHRHYEPRVDFVEIETPGVEPCSRMPQSQLPQPHLRNRAAVPQIKPSVTAGLTSTTLP